MTSAPRAWVLCTGEPLPIDAGVPRLLRAGMLCDHLVKSGFQVDFWTSNFDHATKTRRSESTQTVTRAVSEAYRVRLLPSCGYQRHVSLARVRDHRQIAKAFSKEAPKAPPPDILVISMPTIDLAYAGAKFAHERGLPYIVDLRDLWPEIFYMDRPILIRQIIQLLTLGWSRQLNWVLCHADAVVGITDAFVAWGCTRSGRIRRPKRDLALPLAYPPAQPPTREERDEQASLVESGDLRPDLFQICFLGSISARMDIDTLCKAVTHRNEGLKPPMHLVIAGSGEILEHLRSVYAGPNIKFLGRVNQSTLRIIMRTSKIGIVPYKNSLDFRMSIPNKAIEYLSSGLPIATCLHGALATLVKQEDVGDIYEEASPQTLEQLLNSYNSSPQLLSMASSKALALFASHFSSDIVLNNYIELIHLILNRE